ncbi:MAG TPA: G8 domain-containing protein, partial [Gemmatimonadales bacterium]|nr:G8 domain-containing protein [Gemmatimonadales bacterium]
MNMTMRALLAATVLFIVSTVTGAALARDVHLEKCPKRVLEQLAHDADDDLLIDVDCTVPAGTYTWRNVRIINKGTLRFEDTLNGVINFTAASISIEDGGDLVAGTADLPFGSNGGQLNITFTGAPPNTCEMLDSHGDWCGKGIIVRKGATLYLYGAKGATTSAVSWTHLSDAAGPTVAGAKVPGTGATTLKLARDVTQGKGAWKANDWIAVATTSFNPFETEFVQIDTVNSAEGGTTITLKQGLKHYHFGGKDPGPPSAENYNGARSTAEFNYGVDERAEVGLISRSVRLTAAVDAANPHWGGEIKILNGFTQAVLQGVELEKFGKAHLGAYPIHLHQLGPVAADTLAINANSVHHSYNKCLTLHSSQNVTVENMVCARIIGHIFYQEYGDESGIKYLNNLGLGAMSNSFDVPANLRGQFWAGDNLAATIGYDGFKVPNTDDQRNPVRGVCACRGVEEPARVACKDAPSPTGELTILGNHNPYTPAHPAACSSADVYFEPASGFWIVNPTTVLEGNSIGGCQGVGRAYWYVPPKNDPAAGVPENLRFLANVPIGSFKNNRAHGCFSGLYAEEEYGVFSFQLFPTTNSLSDGKNLITTFEGFTATRIRDRGVWIRPMWSALKHGRFATNKASVILVSSGGLDGNAPGVWALLQDSVLIGMSQNNVERWGPCPVNASKGPGCVDLTPVANDIIGDGYPLPAFNLLGYQIYDGPVRIFNNRFVNFNRDVTQHLTDADKTFLSSYTAYSQGFPATPKKRYEGDAALGWFKANQSAYPNATVSKGLTFDNVDIRHQIFTQAVNYGDFQDGDRNTVIIDEDGSLTGFAVLSSADQRVRGAHPVSLNNLGFNQAGNSVDECLAEGQQDTDVEARPTSLISPYGVATLELQANFPPSTGPDPNPAQPATKQRMTFSKDSKDFCPGPLCDHQKMELTSRNTLGVWEPKVVSGGGYTVAASPCSNPPDCTQGQGGIPARVSVGLTDAVKPVISPEDPFAVRIGICYTDTTGKHPAGNFTITRGYRSWGGNGSNTADLDLQQFFN